MEPSSFTQETYTCFRVLTALVPPEVALRIIDYAGCWVREPVSRRFTICRECAPCSQCGPDTEIEWIGPCLSVKVSSGPRLRALVFRSRQAVQGIFPGAARAHKLNAATDSRFDPSLCWLNVNVLRAGQADNGRLFS